MSNATTPVASGLLNASGSDMMCSISANGECAAFCTPDGVVKFYDTLTSTLKQEYASSTHLQASCSCLAWSALKKHANNATSTTGTSAKQKKLKSNQIESELNDLDLIAIGTAQGAILLYSLAKAALHSQLVN